MLIEENKKSDEVDKIVSVLESVLFITERPLSRKELASILQINKKDLEGKIRDLAEKYQSCHSGIQIIDNGEDLQMVTNPTNSKEIQEFLKTEVVKELTPASLETLSIIAYRGPIGESEISELRGVNCSIIIRNLLLKGLIIENNEAGEISYQVSVDFIRQLGIIKLNQLPDWDKLNNQKPLNELKEDLTQANNIYPIK
jgi:segregation and condensation protein B